MLRLYSRCHTEATAQEAVACLLPSCQAWCYQAVLAGALSLSLGQARAALALLFPTKPRHGLRATSRISPLSFGVLTEHSRETIYKESTLSPTYC